MDQIDYDTCAQFLARLDADAANAITDDQTNNLQSPALSSSYNHNSQSPPGLSSGSAASQSPESLRFEWDPTDPSSFFPDLNDVNLIPDNDSWDSYPQDNSTNAVSPMSEYIKIENNSSPGGYSPEGAIQGTISPGNSLLDPTAQTALEGFSFGGKGDDTMFDFNGGTYGAPRPNDYAQQMQQQWRNQPSVQQQQHQQQQQQQRDFQNQGWPQQQPQPQQMQPPRMPRQQPMPQQQVGSPLRHSMSPSSTSHHTASSPESRADSHSDDDEHHAAAAAPRSKKRKTSIDDDALDQPAAATNGRKQPKKTAHNMIEKRYRTNLNDKIAALRDSVPSLRIMAGTSKMGDDDDDEDLGGLAPAHKLNKATVLAKATEYIRHLEKRNKRLHDENDQLKNRLNAFEKLATMGGNMGGMQMQQQQGQGGGRGGPQGGPGGGLMSRLMVGSLAGLMVVNGFSGSEEEDGKQLFALPMAGEWMGMGAANGNQLFWLLSKMMLLFTAVVYIITPGFFDAKAPRIKLKGSSQDNVSAAPSLASPLKDRSEAWLTAIQTVWVPRHSIGLEFAALGLKAIKLSLRRLIGWERYRTLTGMTEEQELARIKSWTIALDAQLAGGDASINHPRLLLTFLASLTLPKSSARLMLNALHIRVFFSDLPTSFQRAASFLSNHYWLEARKRQETPSASTIDTLPEYLAALLQLPTTDVFDPLILQQAHDLAYNTNNSTYTGVDQGFDTVIKDISIRSPLDALAAWYSSLVLQGVFVAALKSKSSASSKKRIQTDLAIALRTAPTASAAHLRALAANAVLADEDKEQFLFRALQVFEEDRQSRQLPQHNAAVTTTVDIRVAIRCAMALALLKKGNVTEATRLFGDLDWRAGDVAANFGLLGFVASWKTLTTFVGEDAEWAKDAGENVNRAAGMLRVWISDRKVGRLGVANRDWRRVVDFCLGLQRKVAGMEAVEGVDDGYVSGKGEKC